jgi:hypothetical protein
MAQRRYDREPAAFLPCSWLQGGTSRVSISQNCFSICLLLTSAFLTLRAAHWHCANLYHDECVPRSNRLFVLEFLCR